MSYVRRSSRGMGDYCAPGSILDESVGICIPVAGAPSSSGKGFDWSGFVTNLTTSGMNLIGDIFRPPSYQQTVRDPITGQVYQTTVRNTSTPATAASAFAPAAGGPGSNALLWIGAGLVGVLVVGSVLKRSS